MKKNKTLRFAACLLLLCLITTCVIGTTLAKYTTAGNASDEARVAKWGVTISMEADPLFKNEYAKTDTSTTYTGLAVKSEGDAKVVAPGTDSTQAYGPAIFSITGTPEVATRIKIELTNVQDVVLKAGVYKDPTTTADATFTLASDYYPVVFTLKQTKNYAGDIAGGGTVLQTGTLAQIQSFLNTYSGTSGKDYKPNAKLDSEFQLSWAWNFVGNDKADTYLGNLMAGLNPDSFTEDTDYCLKVAYTLNITVTQID